MRILITAPSLNVNKNVSGISSIVKTIIDYNHEVLYIHLLAGSPDNEKSKAKTAYAIVKSYLFLFELLVKNKFDILHVNLALNPKSIYRDYITIRICRLFNQKILVHLHGGKYLLEIPSEKTTNNLIRHILGNADEVIVLSDFEKSMVESLYGVSQTSVLPNAVDTHLFKFKKPQKKSNELKFLFLGRLHESK